MFLTTHNIGDLVEYTCTSKDMTNIGEIVNIQLELEQTGFNPTLFRVKCIRAGDMKVDSEVWVRGSQIKPAVGWCPVCKNDVGAIDGVLKQHNKSNKICYGSFMPI